MFTGLLRIACLLAGLGLATLAFAQTPPRAEIRPGVDTLDLSPYLGMRKDPEARENAATIW